MLTNQPALILAHKNISDHSIFARCYDEDHFDGMPLYVRARVCFVKDGRGYWKAQGIPQSLKAFHFSFLSVSQPRPFPLHLLAALQIRRELITWGYYDGTISHTTRAPRILCSTLWFELPQTGLIQAASGQRACNTFPFGWRKRSARSHRHSTGLCRLLQICLRGGRIERLSLTYCLRCWTQFLRRAILLSLKIPDPLANLWVLWLSWG